MTIALDCTVLLGIIIILGIVIVSLPLSGRGVGQAQGSTKQAAEAAEDAKAARWP